MSDQIANSFELSESILLNFAKGTIDLTDSFAGINIKEDLFKPSLECVLEIIDGTNSLSIVDFDGTETFKIAFKRLQVGSILGAVLFLHSLSSRTRQ